MSFRYGQFGEGFSLTEPSPQALRLEEVLTNRGVNATVILRDAVNEDAYGQPVYIEREHSVKAFVEEKGDTDDTKAGFTPAGSLKLFMVPWTSVTYDSEVEVKGQRYSVTSLIETDAYLQVEAERKIG